jgi:hypothetical protein
MSWLLFFQILALIILAYVLCFAFMLVFFRYFMPKFDEQLDALIDGDDRSLDEVYEDNRQIINPIGENPFTK